MRPEYYLLAHVVGVFMLFLGLGGMLAGGREGAKAPAAFAILHGFGLIVMVIAGVGRMHTSTPPLEWKLWVFGKIGCWVVLGALPFLYRRGVLSRLAALLVVLAIGGVAVWLAIEKPM